MHRSLIFVLLVLVVCAGLVGCAGQPSDPAPVIRGPLPTRNQHPFGLTLLHLRPRRAVTQPKGTFGVGVDLAYSSIHEIKGGPGQLVHMDGEIAHLSTRVRHGVGELTDIELEVGVTYASSGFLDGIIEEFHNLTGLPNQGREDYPNDQFRMELRRNGQQLFSMEEDEIELSDMPVSVTRTVRVEDEHGPALALRAAVELPTGDEDQGAGNGEFDWAIGAVLERSMGRWTLFGGLDLLMPHDPDSFDDAGVALNDIVSAQFGVEYRWSDSFSLLGQVVWTSPMTDDFTFEEFDREILDLSVGAAWEGFGGSRMYLALEEDAVAATGPDFGVVMGLSWGF